MGVTALDHILLLSDDIDATRDFYCRALGLTVGVRPPLEFPGYWLYAAGVPCVHVADRRVYNEHAQRVGLSAAGEAAAGRIDHIAFADCDYEEAAARLDREGVEAVRNAVPGAGLRQLFFADRDGVRVEVNVVDPDRVTARKRTPGDVAPQTRGWR
jgi:catechol 2,3-dioxygenase-like lactoylglutathione lyase family enzyme